jgi:hypothetical protein
MYWQGAYVIHHPKQLLSNQLWLSTGKAQNHKEKSYCLGGITAAPA